MNEGATLRNPSEKSTMEDGCVGRKKIAQLSYFVICLRMVSALRQFAIGIFAIFCEYQTSGLSG